MIIKSLSRKAPSFERLFSYVHGVENSFPVLTHNLYSEADGTHYDSIVDEFEANYAYLPDRKNGNALFHEILAFEFQEEVPQSRQAEMLLDIAERYLAARAPHQLAYGRVHTNTDYNHIHLVISANAPRSVKRVRLSKAQFREAQVAVEDYKLFRYPELGNTRIYKTEEYEMAQHNRKAPTRERLQDELGREMDAAHTHDELVERLAALGYQLYERGATFGVEERETKVRFRFRSLGLDEKFEDTLDRFRLSRDQSSPLAIPELRALDTAVGEVFVQRNKKESFDIGLREEMFGLEKIEQWGREYNEEFIRKHPELKDEKIVVYHDAIRGNDVAVVSNGNIIEIYDNDITSQLSTVKTHPIEYEVEDEHSLREGHNKPPAEKAEKSDGLKTKTLEDRRAELEALERSHFEREAERELTDFDQESER